MIEEINEGSITLMVNLLFICIFIQSHMISSSILNEVLFVLVAHLTLNYILVFAVVHARLRVVLGLGLFHAVGSLVVLH